MDKDKQEKDESTADSNEEEATGTDSDTGDTSSEDNADDKKEAEPSIDYKAELEKTQKELSQAQFKLKEENLKKKNKKSVEEKADTEEDESDEEESTDVEAQIESFKLSQLQDTISEELDSLTDNDDEKALIKHHFENSIKRTGDNRSSIKNDLATARLLANKKRFEKLDIEIAAKKKSKPANGGGSEGHDIEGDTDADTANLSAADKKLLGHYEIDLKTIKK